MCNGTPFTFEKISPRAGIELGPLDQKGLREKFVRQLCEIFCLAVDARTMCEFLQVLQQSCKFAAAARAACCSRAMYLLWFGYEHRATREIAELRTVAMQ